MKIVVSNYKTQKPILKAKTKKSFRSALVKAVAKGVSFEFACFVHLNLSNLNLYRMKFHNAHFFCCDLNYSSMHFSLGKFAKFHNCNLRFTKLDNSELAHSVFESSTLEGASFVGAELTGVKFEYSLITNAYFNRADLDSVEGLIKPMGVEPGNIYWKRFDEGLINNGYQFTVGLNELAPGEVFAADPRCTCSYPGFHFASRSWCARYLLDRPLEARIRIPEDALINEPWGTDGKASANKIEILQVFDVKTRKDVTDEYR